MTIKMDSNCIDYDGEQSTSSASIDCKPDTFATSGIFKDGKDFRCLACNEPIRNVLTIAKHIGKQIHCSRLKSAYANYEEVGGDFKCNLCEDYQTTDWKTFLCHFSEKQHFKELRRERIEALRNKASQNSYSFIMKNQIIEHGFENFFCCCCQQLITGADLIQDHVRSKKHESFQENRDKAMYPGEVREKYCRTFVKNGLYRVNLGTFNCSLCKTLISGQTSSLEHINSEEHMKNLITRENADHQSLLEIYQANGEPQYIPPKLSQVETSESFAERMKENSIIEPIREKWYECTLCRFMIYKRDGVLAHISGTRHKNNMMGMTKGDNKLKPSSKSEETSDDSLNSCKSYPEHSKGSMQYIYEINPERLRTLKLSCQLCFFEASNVIHCLICKTSVASKLQTFYEHIRSSAHTMYLAEAEQSDKRLILAKEFMQTGPGNSVQCFACDEFVQNDYFIIPEHIKEDFHKKQKQRWNEEGEKILQNILVEMKGTRYNIQKFWCQPCDVEYNTESDFTEHMESKEHGSCLHEMGEFQNRLVYDSCIVCAMLWLGFSGIYTQHCSQPVHKFQVQNRDFLASKLPNQTKTLLEDAGTEETCDLSSTRETYKDESTKLHPFRGSTLAKHKNTEPQVSQKENVQPNVVEVCRELERLKQTLTPKTKSDGKISSVIENIKDLENPLNKLSIADLSGENSKKLSQNQSNSTDQTPKHMRPRKSDGRLKNGRSFDPKYLKVDMQHIYEVYPEKLRTMKLSSQLCFPKTSNMIYCLICERSVPSELQTFYEHISSSAHNVYLADAEKNDKHFINYPDQFSNLRIAEEFMQETQEETIQCFACDVSMQNDDTVICEHIKSDFHKERRQIWKKRMEKILQDILVVTESTWYNIQKYWCQPCDMKYNTEFHFAEHMDSKEHHNCLRMQNAFRNKLVYDSCIACATLWLGVSGTYMQHCKQPMHKYLMQSGDFLVCKLSKQTINLLENAEAEVTRLIELSNQVLTVQKAKSEALLKCLEDAVKPIHPNAKAYPFGSRVSGLGFPDSDLDVFLDCGTYDGNDVIKNYQERLILSVEQCLYANQQSWEIQETLVTTRTPIIKLHHRESELSCDVSFKNGLSVENTKLLKCFIDNYPPCRKLMLFLKKWLSLCNLSGSQYITNYATCWYVIFYLQSKGIVPSVASLINKENKSRIIDGWETGISETFDMGEQEYAFTKLLHGFFVFYANFDYRNSVACPILGRTILKQDFTELDLLPKEMAPYINHVVTKNVKGIAELFRIDSEMCIQDPYDLSHNLTKAVQKFTLNRFKRLCLASADLLNNIAEHPHNTSSSHKCDIL